MSEPSLFVLQGERYVPTEIARNGGDLRILHGCPAAALLAHGVEQLDPESEYQVARLSVDLYSPIPVAPLTLSSRVLRTGRRIKVVDVDMICDGRAVAAARALFMKQPAEAVEEPHTEALRFPLPGALLERPRWPTDAVSTSHAREPGPVTTPGPAWPAITWIKLKAT